MPSHVSLLEGDRGRFHAHKGGGNVNEGQKLEPYGHKPRNVGNHQKLKETMNRSALEPAEVIFSQ